MRKTIGRFKRRYLYDCRLGTRRIVKKMKDGRQIWPTLSDLVRYAVLDVQALEGEEDRCFWIHALAAAQEGALSEGGMLRLVAGERQYALFESSDPRENVVGLAHDTLDFGDAGPLATALRSGDWVEVQAVIPARRSPSLKAQYDNQLGITGEWRLPFLPGCFVRAINNKGQKKVCSWVAVRFSGVASGQVYVSGSGLDQGHNRGVRWKTFRPNASVGVDPFSPETRLVVDTGGSCFLYEAYVQFPAFTRVFRLRVLDVVRHG